MTISYAIVGAGMMGREHMRNLALLPNATLVALCDPDPESRNQSSKLAAALKFEPRVFGDLDTMLSTVTPDAVIVATPNFTHFDIARRLLAEKVAILLEKPLCASPDDARRLASMAINHPRTFWVGMEYRFMPPVARYIERVHAEETGAPRMLYIREHRFPFLKKVGDWNRFNRNTGGTLVEKCCHFFDLMRVILRDEPVRVFASGGQDVNHLDELYDGERPDILDNAFVTVDFARGARAVLELCMFAEGSEQQTSIHTIGARGKIEVSIPSGEIIVSPRDRSGLSKEFVSVPADILAAGDHHGATYHQLSAFQDCLLESRPPIVTALDGYRAVAMGAAAQQSIQSGTPIPIARED